MEHMNANCIEVDDWMSPEYAERKELEWLRWLREQTQKAAERGDKDFGSRFIPGRRQKGAGQ